ncbi:MAG TPA: DUF4157 domain-containing protein [Trinickia sp.]|uniref:eCIS core domain-containing protein n=1 Tax=Trinickia sp. TaxID=2571163 RepID=UPI002BD4ABD1|nr:DUF4157 domain-containing protein [Trinickia sp.]HTI18352.1 DUF4157 domain-containing protein [Trinickia sp.]
MDLVTHSPRTQRLGALQSIVDSSPKSLQAIQLQAMANRDADHARRPFASADHTNLPDQLKQGVESLSGISMDDVKVHYGSDKPAQLQALAYAQGTDIHIGPGQEHHLPHEAWHVVQQKQGRVQPTREMKSGVAINSDANLESEADTMGARALQFAGRFASSKHVTSAHGPVQRKAEIYGDADLGVNRETKQAEGIPDAVLDEPLKYQRFRKLNRIGGALYKKMSVPNIEPVVAGVKTFFQQVNSEHGPVAEDVRPADNSIHDASLRAIEATVEHDHALSTPENFEAYSMLGPLDFWVNNQTSSEDIQRALRGFRLKMAERPGVSIIAHRGHGPTNRTRGGLISQEDPRRTSHPAENSKSAFDAAYTQATSESATPKLDGIECDVFLSSDGIPILSHEGNVKEQLSSSRQEVHAALVSAGTEIQDLSAKDLRSIQRTDDAHSNFATLDEFLNASADVAQAYFDATGKPLRVEIEMKGHPSAAQLGAVTGVISGHGSRQRKKEAAAQFEAEYATQLNQSVAKIISKFKKAHPKPWWEIILFNNSNVSAKQFDALRTRKSHLGHLYTGLGSDDAAKGDEARVDELRMSATPAKLNLMKDQKNFIVTYVPGAERRHDAETAPLGELDFGVRNSSEYAKNVNEEMRDTSGAQAKDLVEILLSTAHKKNVHMLTDIPENARHYKQTVLTHVEAATQLNSLEQDLIAGNWSALDPKLQSGLRVLVQAFPDAYPKLYDFLKSV